MGERPAGRALRCGGGLVCRRPRTHGKRDLDLVILSERVEDHLADLAFAQAIAPGGRAVRCEQWGPMHERRVRLPSGLLVEFGVSTPAWAALPLDPGTVKVLSDGCRIVVDDGALSGALESMGRPVMEWRPIR